MDSKEGEDKMALLEKQLAAFLEKNPYSKIQNEEESYPIINPWNDDSISFSLETDYQTDLIKALNNLILPQRFTAIYHLDTNTIEFIYTFMPKTETLQTRQIEFTLNGKSYECRFGDASERLLILSKAFRPTRNETRTEHRNLSMFNAYMNPEMLRFMRIDSAIFKETKPVSFFISGFNKYDENEIIDVSRHLNFFMKYYDRKSPVIIIHSASSNLPEPAKQLRFIETDFPTKISSCTMNPFLLILAEVAEGAQPRLAFLYYYQIIEYAAFYYIENDVKKRMLQIICTPDIRTNPDKYVARILDAVSDNRQSDDAKLNKVVEATCSSDYIWREVKENIDYFSKNQDFEGDFSVGSFVSSDITSESFAAMWLPKTPDTLRKIRNALAHGRENRLGHFIAPSRDNDLKLMPWVSLIRRVAEQVMIFGDIS